MNVIKLMGGLGNQIFQYAFGQVQKFNGIEVAYDLSWFANKNHKDTFREYGLDKFELEVPIHSFIKSQLTVQEAGYDKELMFLQNCNLFGYWQYLSYYQPIFSQLQAGIVVKECFYTPQYLSLKKQAETINSIALHVRRGDYLTTEKFKALSLVYYFNALKLIEGDIFIFSDDLQWCKENFKECYFINRKITFVDLPDYLSFDLMNFCSHNIISNSTFSILAAYLNTNPNNITVGSKDTCIDSWQEKEKKKYLPKDWILL